MTEMPSRLEKHLEGNNILSAVYTVWVNFIMTTTCSGEGAGIFRLSIFNWKPYAVFEILFTASRITKILYTFIGLQILLCPTLMHSLAYHAFNYSTINYTKNIKTSIFFYYCQNDVLFGKLTVNNLKLNCHNGNHSMQIYLLLKIISKGPLELI